MQVFPKLIYLSLSIPPSTPDLAKFDNSVARPPAKCKECKLGLAWLVGDMFQKHTEKLFAEFWVEILGFVDNRAHALLFRDDYEYTRSTQNESPITQNPPKIAEYWKTWEENSVSFHFVPLSQVRQPGQPPSPYTGWPPARKCGKAWRGEEPFTDPIWENSWKARIAIARKEQEKTVSTSAKQQRKKRIRNFNNPSLIILIRFLMP